RAAAVLPARQQFGPALRPAGPSPMAGFLAPAREARSHWAVASEPAPHRTAPVRRDQMIASTGPLAPQTQRLTLTAPLVGMRARPMNCRRQQLPYRRSSDGPGEWHHHAIG